ncbi:hypothetical protein RclHR1_18660006 [Rhizophagus clarus]|uniref:SAM domain-containing protein n=1 Tax=Rhizophagus clarus TaxID=94130 RepID=A0A2Z6R1F4_9GLOM|nr:hypothetical protein RclHR1_18660006 [Rhizophagus clarus]
MSTLTAEYDSYLVENWNTETLVDFLKEQNLKLNDDDLGILRKRKINGQVFLDMSKDDFMQAGLEMGLAMKLAKEVQALKEKLKHVFSSYLSLSEVLAKYNLVSEGTEIIPLFIPFIPQTYEIKEDNKHFVLCMADINLQLQKDATNKKFSMKSEYEIIGNEICRQVDYAIKESLICVTEDKVQQKLTEGFAQNIKQLESSYKMNKRK